ncbi:hypothetical protein SO802_024390 [Lithocarpus litseifolius]|uniref:Major facilitator superfamily (MFS) profile domain-containing protein n=1 Tax=Lithocarpus litseifolius TaxID=425828 RepID=A0AAW2CAY2_9ROSI
MPARNGTTSQPLSLPEWAFSPMHTTSFASQPSQNSWVAFTTIILTLIFLESSPPSVNNVVVGVALVGTLVGQLVFGYLGDKLGRKKVYGITLILMVFCAICSGVSFGASAHSVIGTLCFFKFWLGFGIGGDYPLLATIMSEYANKRTRGAFITAVFAMQGVGIVFTGLVSMTLSAIFLHFFKAPTFDENQVFSTQPEADYLWRIVLMLGALPALLTYYRRMKVPETS